jgi:type III secretion system (T3SS) inner membrane Yop/YscD-like protein
MGAMMWIDVVSRGGEVAGRVRIEGAEATIGRAFDNDVVIDDPHVAPHHLRVYRGEDGELVAEDLGTLNGLFTEHGAKREARLSLATEPGLRIGRTTVRIHDAMHAVAAEKLLTPPRAHARWAGILGAGLLAMLLLLQWLNLTAEPSANLIFLPLLGFVTVLALWTGLWAVLSRVFFGQARFALQLRIAVTACIALVLWDYFTESASFAFAWRDMSEYSGLGAWAVLGAACYGHLHAIGPKHMRVAIGLVFILIVAGALLQYFGRAETRKLVGQRATLGDLRPPSFRLLPLASTDDFFKKAEGAKEKVDKARVKEPAPGGLLADFDSD